MPRLTLTDEAGQLRMIDVSGELSVGDLKVLAEMELGIPSAQQQLVHNGAVLGNAQQSLAAANVANDDIILVMRSGPSQTASSASSSNEATQIEAARQQLLADPSALQRVRRQNPGLADAASDPIRFAAELRAFTARQREAERRARDEELALVNADPFDPEAQLRIERAIRQENIQRNMEQAIELNPEAFGRVIMLYINTEVNGVPVKAFVDSGAQATIMSPACAKRCKIMHLLDERFAGIAEGVGTAKILGRVHSAQIKVGSQFLTCSFTIMEGKGVELLFGLDQLKRHLACIDLRNHCLRINDEEVPFLPEHELPDHARQKERVSREETPAPSSNAGPSNVSSSSSDQPAAVAPHPTTDASPAASSQKYPEAVVKGLMDLGVSREMAIQALDSCGGNADMAANMLF